MADEQTGQNRRASGIPIEERRELRSISRATQTLMEYVRHVAEASGLPEEQAMRAVVTTLCVLEQRIMGDEAKDLNAQLPAILREIVQQCEVHQGKPRKFDGEEFVAMVAAHLGEPDQAKVDQIIRSVLGAVRDCITEGEADQVRDQLPADIRAYWVSEA